MGVKYRATIAARGSKGVKCQYLTYTFIPTNQLVNKISIEANMSQILLFRA